MKAVVEWHETTLGALASVSRGASPRPIASSRWFDRGGEVRWVRIADVNQSNGRTLLTTTQALSPDGIARSRYLVPGTLIMSIAATVGIPVITGVPTCIHDGFVALENLKADQRFLLYLLKTSEGKLRESGQSGSQMNVNTDIVKCLHVFIPTDQKEQRRIASALWDIDNCIATLERLIAKKQAIKQGMMQQLLTGRTRLPGFVESWDEVELGSIATVTMGQSPAGSTYHSDCRGLPLIQGNADIRERSTSDRIWTTAPTKTCEAGDVLLTVRAPVGYTAIASKRSCLGRGVCALNARSDNRFLFHALIYAEPTWVIYEQGSTFTAVNSNVVRSFTIQWPSDADERTMIAGVLDDADAEIAALQARLTKARAIKTGMMQQLLTGRIRLPMEDAS